MAVSYTFIFIALAIVFAILCFGIYTLFRGGDFGRSWSNKAMRMRIVAQFVAIPEFQGIGFGRLLFDAARALLSARGLRGLAVWALEDNDRALDFYVGVLGMELQAYYGEDAAFVSAGGYHHPLGLNTWESLGGSPPPPNSTGLYHVAILYPTRPALADYIADPAEKAELAAEIFGHVGAGCIKIEINQSYALQDAVQAHRDLESRKTTGSSIFVI